MKNAQRKEEGRKGKCQLLKASLFLFFDVEIPFSTDSTEANKSKSLGIIKDISNYNLYMSEMTLFIN